MGNNSVTYFPASHIYMEGRHESMPHAGQLLASTQIVGEGEKAKIKTSLGSNKLKALVAAIKNNKAKIQMGQLTAADFVSNRANLDSLILIRLYNQIMGEQVKWFHLDNMFNSMTVDKLLLRIPFKDNPAAAQTVPRRGEYDTSKVNYEEINLDLPKVVVSHDMPIEDPLRALIDPLIPLQQTDEYSMLYHREKEALAALKELKYHYTKDASGAAKFSATSAPSDTKAKRISNPTTLTAGNVHSDHKMVNDIQDARNEFMEQFDIILTHYAMSPRTAMAIAQNTWTESNTIFNVEAYRTNGGVRPFPGLAEATAVISQVVPDNIIYASSKPNNVLIKAEGPKITKTWEDNNHWTTQTATADFHQYKCAHEDLKMDRKFGLIFDLQTT